MKVFWVATLLIFQHLAYASSSLGKDLENVIKNIKLDDHTDDVIDDIANALEKAANWTRKEVDKGVDEITKYINALNNINETTEEYLRRETEKRLDQLNKFIDKITANKSGILVDTLQCIEDLKENITNYTVDILNVTLDCNHDENEQFAEDARTLLEHLNETSARLDTLSEIFEDCKGQNDVKRILCLIDAGTDLVALAIDLYNDIKPDLDRLGPEFVDLIKATEKCVDDQRRDIVDDLTELTADVIECVNHKENP